MAKQLVGGLVVTLLAVSFGASYGWTCHGSTECQPSSLLAIDTSLQTDVQLVQIIAGPNASSSTGSNNGPPTLIAGVNIVAKPGSTLNEVLSEANSMQSSMKTITGTTLTSNYNMVFVASSKAETVTVGGNAVVYVYITIWLISGAGSVPADATAQSLLLDAYDGLAGWSKGKPGSVQLGESQSAATSSAAQSGGGNNSVSAAGDPHMTSVTGAKFDILRSGNHTLLHIPQHSPQAYALVFVRAFVKHEGPTCLDMYIESLHISGKLAEERQRGGFSFFANQSGGVSKGWLSFGKLDLKVVYGTTVSGVRYLNMFARHLAKLGLPIGGILGLDDHVSAATPETNCQRRVSL